MTFNVSLAASRKAAAFRRCLARSYLRELDDAMAAVGGVTYVRFQDDLCIVAAKRWPFRRAVAGFRRVLSRLGMQLRPEKTEMGRMSSGVRFPWFSTLPPRAFNWQRRPTVA